MENLLKKQGARKTPIFADLQRCPCISWVRKHCPVPRRTLLVLSQDQPLCFFYPGMWQQLLAGIILSLYGCIICSLLGSIILSFYGGSIKSLYGAIIIQSLYEFYSVTVWCMIQKWGVKDVAWQSLQRKVIARRHLHAGQLDIKYRKSNNKNKCTSNVNQWIYLLCILPLTTHNLYSFLRCSSNNWSRCSAFMQSLHSRIISRYNKHIILLSIYQCVYNGDKAYNFHIYKYYSNSPEEESSNYE